MFSIAFRLLLSSRLSIEISFSCREHWPHQTPSSSSLTSGIRDAYLARRTALRQFKFLDPFVFDNFLDAKPFDHILFDKNEIVFSQVSMFLFLFFFVSPGFFGVVLTLYLL